MDRPVRQLLEAKLKLLGVEADIAAHAVRIGADRPAPHMDGAVDDGIQKVEEILKECKKLRKQLKKEG